MARKDQGSILQEFQFVLRDGIYTTLSLFDAGSCKTAPRGYTGFRPSFTPVIPSPKQPTNKSDKPGKKPNEMAYLCYNLESAVYVYKFDGKVGLVSKFENLIFNDFLFLASLLHELRRQKSIPI